MLKIIKLIGCVFQLSIIDYTSSFYKTYKLKKITNTRLNSNDDIKYIDDYYDTWGNGEVLWDLPNPNNYICHNPNQSYQSYPSYQTELKLQDSIIYEKYFKNRIYIRFKKKYINHVYYSLINVLYKDVINLENVVFDVQDLIMNKLAKENIETNLILLLMSTSLKLIYDKNKLEDINNLKLMHNSKKKEELLEEYNRIKRFSNKFFIILLTIMFKNIKNAE